MARLQMNDGVDLKAVGNKLIDLANTHFGTGYDLLEELETDFVALFQDTCLQKSSDPTLFIDSKPTQSGVVFRFHYDTTINTPDHSMRVVNIVVPDLQGKYDIAPIEERIQNLREGEYQVSSEGSIEDEISALHASINLNKVAVEAMGMVVILGCQ